ncbi:MAG: arsenate reductase (azurin) small subunit [Gallionellales bacterium 35-53-114]|jgi:arsenite oxidase small subunit|nr:MAG: arsenate reductase (azurin) small subunit [Gallionellales bacterium 35-53-114]OYZ64927.1 MAG: arsenate reductase (azurin) small subunit [Gallionellales bacterium 24-53-125]OZB07536.1 MAG: arsenate reductase (azurin) small subunit [Gallionellales bacterium 39-52-133]HQS58791.1 arsenate reductase (azurin) small subunit [Gallionellaceae bacterium]HQS75131.1 arsenate reductase (azurin) small subunit [Gallionellaceae bacterium]
MSETVSRRDFFKISGSAVAGVGLAVSGVASGAAEAAVNTSANLPYPHKPIAHLKGMKVNVPVSFLYPDQASPCVAIRTGKPVPGGVGPDNDIVAYSVQCTHQGCPVSYDSAEKSFKCPCHFSMFDAEKQGQVICGQAPTKLPQIVLEYDAKSDSVSAVSVIGLIYGRQANIL